MNSPDTSSTESTRSGDLKSQPARRRVLEALNRYGPVRDGSGRSTSQLADVMGYESQPLSLSPLLLALEQDGLIERELRGRRCYAIALTSKGQAMVELNAGLFNRAHVAPPPSDEASEPGETNESMVAVLELFRRDLRDVLIEVGELRKRVTELERRADSASAPQDPTSAPFERLADHRSERHA